MKNIPEFKKPYGKEIFGKEFVCGYVYPEEELKANDIFQYFVLDGGAFNYMKDIIGSVTGEGILDKVMSGELFELFQNGGTYNWEKSYAHTEGTDFRKKHEWQCWPQRLYLLLPVAQAFLRTGDKKYSDRWLEIVKGYDKAHPYLPYDEKVRHVNTNMAWRDMQVPWRTVIFLHSFFMLKNADYSMEEWKYLYDYMYLHMKHLALEAKNRLRTQWVQNHALLIGTALVMSSCMFPEFDISDECLELGKQVISLNMRGIYADGGSVEDSPSYSLFIARIFLEPLLMLKNNSKESIEGLEDCVLAQYRWIYLNITPCGNMPRFSNTFSIDSEKDIENVKRLIDLDLPKKQESVLFPDSNEAIVRKGDLTLYVDAINIPNSWGDVHRGRPQILLYYKDRPIITDPGVYNYDRWEFYMYCLSAHNHNIVFSPEINELEMELHTKITDFSNDYVACEARVIYKDYEYLWTRTFEISENKIVINDEIKSNKELPWRSRLFFVRADTLTYTPSDTIFQQIWEDSTMKVTSDKKYSLGLLPAMNETNDLEYAIVLENVDKGFEYKNRFVIEFNNR